MRKVLVLHFFILEARRRVEEQIRTTPSQRRGHRPETSQNQKIRKFTNSKMKISRAKTHATKYSQGNQPGSKLLLKHRQKSFGVAKGFGFALFHFLGSWDRCWRKSNVGRYIPRKWSKSVRNQQNLEKSKIPNAQNVFFGTTSLRYLLFTGQTNRFQTIIPA